MFQPGANLYPVAFGTKPENVEVPHIDVRAPTTTDFNYPIGKHWIFINTAEYVLVGLTSFNGATTANWFLVGSGTTSSINSITGDTGGAELPSSGNFNLLGTANQITVTGSAATETFSIPATFIAPGSIASTTTMAAGTSLTVGTTLGVTGLSTLAALTQIGTTLINASGAAVTTIGTGGTGAVNIGNATGNTAVTGSLTASTSLTATLGNITATNGNHVFGTAGNKIISTSVGTTIAAGANSFGSVTLVGGSAIVSTSAVTSTSLIFLSRLTVGATGAAALGILSVGTIVNGVSFVINAWLTANATSLATTDVSNIAYMIVN